MIRMVGESVTFTCNATGVPLPNITWSNESGDSIAATSDMMTDNGTMRVSELELLDLEVDDFQTYTCNATNQFGSDTEIALLQCKTL